MSFSINYAKRVNVVYQKDEPCVIKMCAYHKVYTLLVELCSQIYL